MCGDWDGLHKTKFGSYSMFSEQMQSNLILSLENSGLLNSNF